MSRALAGMALLAAVALALLAAWRLLALGIVSPLPDSDTAASVSMPPSHTPQARLAWAEQQRQAGQLSAAANAARALLHDEPLAAEALVLLARVAEGQQATHAATLFTLAVQRAPRDQYARAWVIGAQLNAGDYAAALTNINTLLNIAPPRVAVFLPLLVDYAQLPAFASALVVTLQSHPGWRAGLLDALRHDGQYPAVDAVYDGLQNAGDLGAAEAADWLAWLGQAGRWGEAYSRWASGLPRTANGTLALIHDGGFDSPWTGRGFDWQVTASSGVLIDRVDDAGGMAVQVSFLGRRAEDIGFQQTVLLAPGQYRLRFRARASDLRSDKGIAWAISCHGDDPMRAVSAPLKGSFEWQTREMAFRVPAAGCPAQTLALVNLGADGAGKIVAGTLWFDDFQLAPVAAAAAAPEAAADAQAVSPPP
ncbi:MAG TPA: hypothetical protein VFN09_03880 [Rhodanobacteraceae bacterium]|nr:hypothetical protein [Rhodanobacteraceae bacterium]